MISAMRSIVVGVSNMDEALQLFETTMAPNKRVLLQIKLLGIGVNHSTHLIINHQYLKDADSAAVALMGTTITTHGPIEGHRLA